MSDTAKKTHTEVKVRVSLLDDLQRICNHIRAIAGQPDADVSLHALFFQLDEIRRELAGRGNHASHD